MIDSSEGSVRPKVLVIDIGSHKAEEVWLFEGKPAWTPRNLKRMLSLHGGNVFAATRQIARITRASRDFARDFDCRYVLVEPVVHRELCDFVLHSAAILIAGVSSDAPNGPVDLLLAQDSLGHSLHPQKPHLTDKTMATYNFEFTELYAYVVKAMGPPEHAGAIVLRMNAEGVEGPIISFLAQTDLHRPAIFAGSLGDIKKCFGQDAYDTALTKLSEAQIPFSYLTSHPKSWESALSEVDAALRHHVQFVQT